MNKHKRLYIQICCSLAKPLLVQSLSRVQLFATPWTAACQASLSITNSQRLFKLMSIASVMLSGHLILCLPLPLIFPSIRVFYSESVLCIRWPKYCSFSYTLATQLQIHTSHFSVLGCLSGPTFKFIHDILHVSMPFSQIFPPSPSPTESIRLFYFYNNEITLKSKK